MPRAYVKKGGNGGRRPGAGRPKSSKSRQDSLLHVKSLRDKFRELPVPFWLRILNDAEVSIEHRCRAAIAALPYVHRRVAPEKRVPEACPYCKLYNLALLSDKEYELLQQMLIKCSTGRRSRTARSAGMAREPAFREKAAGARRALQQRRAAQEEPKAVAAPST
jgi:hypothetical protein